MVVDRAGRDFWSHARLSLGRANMLDAYLESHLYSDPQYAIIAVSRPAGTGKRIGAIWRLRDVKASWRKEPHETASSCSVWIWHRRSVAGRGTAHTTSMVGARVWPGRLHHRCRHGSLWLDFS